MIWIAVLCCLLVSFTFSGIEAGVLSVNRVRLRHRAKMRERAAVTLQRMLSHPERMLITVLIMTNLMNIIAILLSTSSLVRWLGAPGYLVSAALWLPLYLFVSELLPKSIFRRFPYRALAALSGVISVFYYALLPLINAGAWLTLIVLPKAAAPDKKLFVGREDFKYLTIESERQGTLTPTAREMIHAIVDFRTLTARDLMAPLDRVLTVRTDSPVAEVLAMARNTNAERLPVVAPTGEITGLVNVFELLLEQPGDGSVARYQRRIVNIPAAEAAYSVMRKLRSARVRLAAVLDEEGKAIGTVNSETLIHRLIKPAVG